MSTLEISHWFPPEIILQILLKASVKSLLRCKSVCKEWYSLISDQHFIKSHYTLSSTNINYEHHRLICNNILKHGLYSCRLSDVMFDKSVNIEVVLDNPPRSQEVSIVGSCNGLVCLKDDNTVFIYNPSTRTTNILPVPIQGANSVFVFYGFGYDEMTHDYKVVKLYKTWTDWGTVICSLKAGSWKKIDRFPLDTPLNDGKFLNGALHWATGDHWSSGDIVSLDLGKETYGKILHPEYNEVKKRLTLGVLGEWLCVLCSHGESCVVDVWVMKVYGMKDSWTKLASIPYPHTWRYRILSPLCISNDGKVLLKVGLKLLVYDSKDSSFPEIENFYEIHEAYVVVESLVSPFPPLALADNNEN